MSSDTTFISLSSEHNPLLGLTLAHGANGAALVAFVCVFLAGLAYASFTDLYRGRQTPNWFTHSALLAGVILPPFVIDNWRSHYIAAGVVAVLFAAGWWFAGIGFGDVKLYVAVVLLFGLAGVFMIAVGHVVAAAISGPWSLIARARGSVADARKMQVPMFPYIAVGVLVTLPAIGMPAWAVWSGAGALAGAVVWGVIERRWFPLPTIATLAAPLTDGASAVRLRPGERPAVPAGERAWRPVAGATRISGGAIDHVVQGLLTHELWKDLHAAGEVRVSVPADAGAPRMHADIIEILGGYTLTLRAA